METEYKRALKDAGNAINDFVFFSDKVIRDQREQDVINLVQRVVDSIKWPWRLVATLLFWTNWKRKVLDEYNEHTRSYYTFPRDFADANVLYKDHVEKSAGPANQKAFIRSQIDRMKDLEKEYKDPMIRGQLLEPGQTIVQNFVITFPRGIFRACDYTLTFRVDYLLSDEQPHPTQEIWSTTVAPSPTALCMMAAIASFIGMAARLSKAGSLKASTDHLFVEWVLPAMISIVALLASDTISFGKGKPKRIDWRCAILFGFLAGLLNAKLLAAFEQFAK